MKRWLCIFAAAASLLAPAAAQESTEDQLYFLEQLRSRRMADLALEYLQKIEKTAPPELAKVLPLELARTRVAIARERPPEEQMKFLTQALDELKQYKGKLGGQPQAAQIQLEIAKVLSYEGQALLGQSVTQEDEESTKAYAKKAFDTYAQAEAEFGKAKAELTAAVQKLKGDDPLRERLGNDLFESIFLKAQTMFWRAGAALHQTALEQAELRGKADEILADLFTGKDEKGEPLNDLVNLLSDPVIRTRSLAVAWQMRIDQQSQKQVEAQKHFEYIMNIQDERVEAGQRMAFYFFIDNYYENPIETIPVPTGKGYRLVPTGDVVKTKDKSAVVEYLCQKWLSEYPAYHNTPPGQGVKYELANVWLKRALQLEALGQKAREEKKPAEAKQYVEEADKLFANSDKVFVMIADTNSDLAADAKIWHLKIRMRDIGQSTSVGQLKNFEDCFIKARYEISQAQEITQGLGEAPPPKRSGMIERRREHFRTVLAALQRALELAGPATPPHKVNEARFLMSYVYLLANDPYRAAVMGEYLARQEPPGKDASAAATYALQAYANILAAQEAEANRKQLEALAQFIVEKRKEQWAGSPVVPAAQYQLAMVDLREKDYDGAIQLLDSLPADFHAYIFAQSQLALTALSAARKEVDPGKVAAYQKKALDALNRIPRLPEGTDAATAQMFFAAQLEHAQLLYAKAGELLRIDQKAAAKKYEDMDNFVGTLREQFDKVKGVINDATAEPGEDESRTVAQIGQALEALSKYGKLGTLRLAYQGGDYARVVEQTAPVVAKVKEQDPGPEERIVVDQFKVTAELMGLNLRGLVQTGQIEPAKNTLDLILRLQGTGIDEDNPTVVLQGLLADLQNQVKDLKGQGKAGEEKLKEVVQNFSTFLDVLGKQKRLSRNDVLFLANSYASLEKHGEAADMYRQIDRPKYTPPPEPQNPTPAELEKFRADEVEAKQNFKKEEQIWWVVQSYYARELRLAGEHLKEDGQADKAEEKFAEAEKVINTILNDKSSVGTIRAMQEKNMLYEARDQYREAIGQWSQFLANRSLQEAMKNNPQMKEVYFDGYYRFIYCWYKYSQTPVVVRANREKDFLEKAATQILRLEGAENQEGWNLIRERVEALLQEAPRLKEAYDRLKAAGKTS